VSAQEQIAAALVALGIRPIKSGSLTLHFGRDGRLEGVQEVRHHRIPVAEQARAGAYSSGPVGPPTREATMK